ncbi:TolC family protein [Ruficoccus amylovorans]|uniref:TolC family protein n=1 Tax=Ruficoccus amylovorans TaxID=1804625 RepID=A0A842HCE8_9BACT|nr:TolC family protein [Ruficoccus amylovorans]MBC2593930.1 TolC family protein [Ruficoccus amylovorans]
MAQRLTVEEIARELRPYPGRDWMTARIVLSVLLATVIIMALRIPNGWLSIYFSFVFAKPTTRQTFLITTAVVIVVVPVVLLALVLLKYTAEYTWLRLTALAAVLYGAFFLANIMTEGDIVRNLTIIFATALTLPDVYPYPHLWVQGTMWLMPIALAGVIPVMLTTLLIRPERNWPPEHRPPPPKLGIVPDWRSNPAHLVYALKCTFAAMGTYFIYTLLNFQEIQTAMMTCLILALPTTEQIIHKTWLRIGGATVGAGIALFCAIWIIPLSNSIAVLLLAIGVGSTLAAWVALSSPRLSYAGWQMALAQFMMISTAFGPSTDLTVLRDRLLGILLGNIMMGMTFKYLWPEKPSGSTLGKALPLLCVGALAMLFTGCQNTAELAPQSPSRPWRSPEAEKYRLPQQYAHPTVQSYEADHEYTLSELADLAQRNNPKTRIAWEQARAAAAGVGVAQSAYFPELNLIAAAGYEHVPFPLPQNIFSAGFFYSDMAIVRPEVQVSWLLWDFGRREAIEKGAREQSVAQNFAFNALHQQLLFDVCQSYYKLISLRSALAVVTAAQADARLIEKATQSALDQGFATRAELLQTKQQVAQFDFDVSALQADLRKAQVNLCEIVGLDPGQPLRVQDITELPLPDNLDSSVNALVDSALANRPDLSAHVAQLRAAEANVEQVEAQYGPTLAISGNAGPVYSAFNADNTGWVDTFEAEYGGAVVLSLPVFDGGRRQHLKIAAQAEKREVEAVIADARNNAVSEVWEAYTDYENARRQLRSAEALVAASEASQQATLASFEQGFASVTDVQTQQALLIKARESYNQARTDIFLSASLLQFATGQLTAGTVEPEIDRQR